MPKPVKDFVVPIVLAIVIAALTSSITASITIGRFAERQDLNVESIRDHDSRMRILEETTARQDERLKAIDDRTKAIARKVGAN